MTQDLFKNLPSETIIDILSRLPVQTVISCKCVQKSWLHLVETREFVKSHLSKSIPGLIIAESTIRKGEDMSTLYNFFEFEDGFDVEHHDLHYKLVTKFDVTDLGWIIGSAGGLLLMSKLVDSDVEPIALSICNPITRDYINLPYPQVFDIDTDFDDETVWGFGSSKLTSQYKVVMIFQDSIENENPEVECFVYTLGTRFWRRLASRPLLGYTFLGNGVFANENLYWLVYDLDCCLWISCFDLETEHFSTLSAPPFPWNGENRNIGAVKLFALGDCLGLCDSTSDDEIVIWSMKEHGVEKPWIQEYVMTNVFKRSGRVCPIKVFKDGDILMLWVFYLFYYSSKTKTTQKVDMFKQPNGNQIAAILHTPSFLPLKSFGLNVSTF
ncbi:hypothetical protein ACS0TY_035135 [Phlomoides rotata]